MATHAQLFLLATSAILEFFGEIVHTPHSKKGPSLNSALLLSKLSKSCFGTKAQLTSLNINMSISLSKEICLICVCQVLSKSNSDC